MYLSSRPRHACFLQPLSRSFGNARRKTFRRFLGEGTEKRAFSLGALFLHISTAESDILMYWTPQPRCPTKLVGSIGLCRERMPPPSPTLIIKSTTITHSATSAPSQIRTLPKVRGGGALSVRRFRVPREDDRSEEHTS